MKINLSRPLYEHLWFVKLLIVLLSIGAGNGAVFAQKQTKPLPAIPSKDVQAKDFSIGPSPAWVKDTALTAEKRSEGVYYRLLDSQTLLDGASQIAYFHTIKEATDISSLAAVGAINIVFDPSYESLTFHKIEVVREGKRINALDRSKVKLIQRESNLEYQIYNGKVTASITLEDLRVGDAVDFSYSVRGANPAFEGKYIDSVWMASGEGAASQIRYRLLAPENRKINYKNSWNAQFETRRIGNQVELTFTRKLVPQLESDPRTPAWDYQREQVFLREFNDWQEIATWGKRLFDRSTSDSSEALKEVTASIKSQSSVPEERLRLSLDFVQKEIRYFATAVGPYGYQPFQISKVLSQRFGDCKDKTALLIAILRELDIKAEPALASTYLRERLDSSFATPFAFNHAIAKVSLDDKTYWLDATRSLQSGSVYRRQSFGLGKALVLSERSPQLASIPGLSDRNAVRVEDAITMQSWQHAPQLTTSATYYGETAEAIRLLVSQRSGDKSKLALSADIVRAYPGIEPIDELAIEDDTSDNAIKVTQKFSMPSYWKFPEQRYLSSELVLWGVIAPIRFENEVNRKRPFEIASPGIYSHRLRIDFPSEVSPNPNTVQKHEGNKFVDIRTTSRLGLSSFELDGELRIKESQVEPTEWPAYTEFLRKNSSLLWRNLTIPTMTAEQAEQLNSKIRALTRSWDGFFAKDKPKTSVQSEARIKALVLSAQIDAGRLSSEHLAQVLRERGVQLDHSGLFMEGKADFVKALQISPDDAETLAEAAVNAFSLGDDVQAEKYIRKAMELNPTKSDHHGTLARIRYFAQDYVGARQEISTLLKGRTDGDGGYGYLQLALVEKRLGNDVSKAIGAYHKNANSDWPYPILDYLTSVTSLESTLNRAKGDRADISKLCEMYYYIGEAYFIEGRIDLAKEYFKKAIDTGVVEFIEHTMAKRRLASM